jgi:hypothetical protein
VEENTPHRLVPVRQQDLSDPTVDVAAQQMQHFLNARK